MLINSSDSSPRVRQPGTSRPDDEAPPPASAPPDLLYFDMGTPGDPEGSLPSSGSPGRLCFDLDSGEPVEGPSSGSPERLCFDITTDESGVGFSASGSPDGVCLELGAMDTKPSSSAAAGSPDLPDPALDGDEGKPPMSSPSDFQCVDLDIGSGYEDREVVQRAGHRRGRTPSIARKWDLADRMVPLPTRRPLLSVDHLREIYGSRPNFWGDLSAREARIFYKELLPETIRQEALARGVTTNSPPTADGEEGSEGCDIKALEELARLASTARHAARLYTRERCVWLPRFLANVYDGCRHLWKYGTFRYTTRVRHDVQGGSDSRRAVEISNQSRQMESWYSAGKALGGVRAIEVHHGSVVSRWFVMSYSPMQADFRAGCARENIRLIFVWMFCPLLFPAG